MSTVLWVFVLFFCILSLSSNWLIFTNLSQSVSILIPVSSNLLMSSCEFFSLVYVLFNSRFSTWKNKYKKIIYISLVIFFIWWETILFFSNSLNTTLFSFLNIYNDCIEHFVTNEIFVCWDLETCLGPLEVRLCCMLFLPPNALLQCMGDVSLCVCTCVYTYMCF